MVRFEGADDCAPLALNSNKKKAALIRVKARIKKLEEIISSLSTNEKSKISSPNDSLLVLESSNISDIPQVDGFVEDGGEGIRESKCETCELKFIAKEEWYEHTHYGHDIVIGHDFCCDECLICFKSKLESDFHELEFHKEEHYAQFKIPESTKLIFLQRKSWSLEQFYQYWMKLDK